VKQVFIFLVFGLTIFAIFFTASRYKHEAKAEHFSAPTPTYNYQAEIELENKLLREALPRLTQRQKRQLIELDLELEKKYNSRP
jgi:hypothetical protein